MQRLFFLIILLLSMSIYGQRQSANWYFGNNAGLNFSNGTIAPLLDGELMTIEGCTAISDKDTGNLLFYSEGKQVWNRNHQIMPNGDDLLGSFSSTQSAVVVPQPGSNTRYIMFTSDATTNYNGGGTGNGVNYSIIDMSRAGGLGDVVEKNVPLLPQGSEKLTGVNTADGEDFWVTTHFQNKFYSYKVTSSGVSAPVISAIGPTIDKPVNIRGALKASPDGSKLAIAHFIQDPSLSGMAFLYDFDSETGVVSNQRQLGNSLVYYGAGFSPNSTKLYMGGKSIGSDGFTERFVIEQFDMEASNIPGSRIVIADFDDDGLISDLGGSLQVALDGKIYHALPDNNISVIRTPNLSGLNADYRPFAVSLGFNRSSSFGLPPYIQSFFESIVTIENLCFMDTTEFTVDPAARVTSATWNFGDPASGAANTSTDINTSHVFSSTGLYEVTVDFEFQNRIPKRFIEFVEVSPILNVNMDTVLTQCDIDGSDDGRTKFNLNEAIDPIIGPTTASNPDFEITANFFKTMANAMDNINRLDPIGYSNTTNNEVIYARVFENSECFVIAPLILNVQPQSKADPIVLTVCDTDDQELSTTISLDDITNVLRPDYPIGEITYFDTEEDALLELNPYQNEILFGPFQTPDVYYRVEIPDEMCSIIGYASFDIKLPPDIENENIFFCAINGSVTLTPGPNFSSYLWSTDETSSEIEVDEPGVYEVTVSNGEGCTDMAVYFVTQSSDISIIEVVVNDFQQSNSITINAMSDSPGGLLYSIDGGISFLDTPTFSDVAPGFYSIVVRDREQCSEAREDLVLVRGVPKFFTPNSDGIHDFWHVDRARSLDGLVLRIFDRYGKLLSVQSNRTNGWDGTYNGTPMPTSAYWYSLEFDNKSYAGHFMLIRR